MRHHVFYQLWWRLVVPLTGSAGAARAALIAQASYLSRPKTAAALLRRLSRLARRRAASRRRAATGSSSGSSEKSIDSSNSEQHEAEETPATSVPMVVVTMVESAALRSRQAIAEQSFGGLQVRQRSGGRRACMHMFSA